MRAFVWGRSYKQIFPGVLTAEGALLRSEGVGAIPRKYGTPTRNVIKHICIYLRFHYSSDFTPFLCEYGELWPKHPKGAVSQMAKASAQNLPCCRPVLDPHLDRCLKNSYNRGFATHICLASILSFTIIMGINMIMRNKIEII